ncbi:DUF4920 domain-containing protein [Lewinella cohaerens]|uniref:DUF4920 domain-containing protein n=1 Tax=Lewinella cohaerens TaxID=70995 RepID=UPI00036BF4B7|nr:DUF4920 domain-containing protein [Lewinella cohaerens]
MKYFFQLLALVLFVGFGTACGSTGEAATESDSQTEEQAGDESFGAEFTPEAVIAYQDLSAKVTDTDSMAITVRGKVSEVCQSKGCWMSITNGDGEDMMVRFKDYGFFMPKDIAGREVIMNGKAFYQTTPVDELRHYAEDAGKSQEEIDAITEPKRELSFLADGVILVKE